MTTSIDPYSPLLERIDDLERQTQALLDELQISEATDKMWVHITRIQFNTSFTSARHAVNKPAYWDNANEENNN